LFNIYLQIKLFLRTEFIAKVIWVLNNFLTMEFYRKICNRLYWKKLVPHTASYNTRFWILIFGALSAIWLAFYYNPNDPTNSNSSGFIILLFALVFKKSGISFHSLVKNISKSLNHKIDLITYHILDSENIFLWRSRETYLKTSSLLV
jgi:hypothetical protein